MPDKLPPGGLQGKRCCFTSGHSVSCRPGKQSASFQQAYLAFRRQHLRATTAPNQPDRPFTHDGVPHGARLQVFRMAISGSPEWFSPYRGRIAARRRNCTNAPESLFLADGIHNGLFLPDHISSSVCVTVVFSATSAIDVQTFATFRPG